MSANHPRTSSRGITLIEVIVAISIIAILASLLISGALAVRESARKDQCVNNLRQFGIANQNYMSIHRTLPAGNNGQGVSLHAVLLPMLEHQDIYNKLNFSTKLPSFLAPENDTVKSISVSVFLCPSDTFGSPGSEANNSYLGNQGVFSDYGKYGRADDGVFITRDGTVTDAMIRDGLSNTIGMSEWTQQPNVAKISLSSDAIDVDELRAMCKAASAKTFTIFKQSNWLSGNFNNTLYNHVMDINGSSCVPDGRLASGAWTAGSGHGDGCNSLFVDGHVNFMKSSMSINVWRALATRSSGEIVSSY